MINEAAGGNDVRRNIDLLSRVLSRDGYGVISASNGSVARDVTAAWQQGRAGDDGRGQHGESLRHRSVSLPHGRVVRLAGQAVRIYSLDRTVADCFRFRNKVGLDVALEALTEHGAANASTRRRASVEARALRGERCCRLSTSEFAEGFILKGATLLMLWSGEPIRPTKDVDLLGFGDTSAAPGNHGRTYG